MLLSIVLVLVLVLGSGAAAQSTSVPTAVTGGGSSLTATTVTLGGLVDAKGVPATFWFEYGVGATYGTTTDEQPVPAGSGDAVMPAGWKDVLPLPARRPARRR